MQTQTMENAAVEFGAFIREQRLGREITARDAAAGCGMLPSNFSKLEHGVLLPPQDADRQKALAAALGIKEGTEESARFFDLAAAALKATPVDIAEIISRDEALPLLLRTIGNKRLNKKEIERLLTLVLGAK